MITKKCVLGRLPRSKRRERES